MKTLFLYRYLRENRYYYMAVIFIYTASLSCGMFCSRAVLEPWIYSYTVWSLLIKSAIPVLAAGMGGLFFAGSLLIFAAVCYSAYISGFIIGVQFALSIWYGIIYVFICAIPLGIIYLCCVVFSAVTAFKCNAARYSIRRKGLARPMTSFEIRQYISKLLICLGINIIALILEYYVFAAAYVNLIKYLGG